MAVRRMVVLVLCLALLAAPFRSAHASADDTGSRSRVGVLLMVMCGLAAKASIPAPVPWAGVAVLSCLFGFIDAAMSEDNPNAPAETPAPGHP